jgi:hypothetical protein
VGPPITTHACAYSSLGRLAQTQVSASFFPSRNAMSEATEPYLYSDEEIQAILDGLPPLETTFAGVPPRRCAVCGASIVLKRSDAQYCGGACRQCAYRARRA